MSRQRASWVVRKPERPWAALPRGGKVAYRQDKHRPPEGVYVIAEQTTSCRPFSSFWSTAWTWPSFSYSFYLSTCRLLTCCRSGLRDLLWLGSSGLSVEPSPPRKREEG